MPREEKLYLMENGREEAERVDDKTDRVFTKRMLHTAGLHGAHEDPIRAVDIGCGPGTTSDCMREMLNGNGRVTGVDMSAERLAYAGEHYPGVIFVQSEAEDLPFFDEAFNFTWSRFLFEYLADPTAALKEMIRVTRRGGIVVVGDLSLNCTAHFGTDPELEEMVRTIDQFAKEHKLFDSNVGGKLYPMFHQFGDKLEDITHYCEIYHHFAGPIPANHNLRNWKAKLDTLAPIGIAALGGESQYADFALRMMRHLQDERTLTFSVFHLVWARRI